MLNECLHAYDFPISKTLHVSVGLQFPFTDPKSAPHIDQQGVHRLHARVLPNTVDAARLLYDRSQQIVCSSQQITVTYQDNEDQEEQIEGLVGEAEARKAHRTSIPNDLEQCEYAPASCGLTYVSHGSMGLFTTTFTAK